MPGFARRARPRPAARFPAPRRRARHAARVRPTWAWRAAPPFLRPARLRHPTACLHAPPVCRRGCASRAARPGLRPGSAPAPPTPAARSPPTARCPAPRARRLCPRRAPRGDQIFANGSQETAAPSRVNFREIADRGYHAQKQKKRALLARSG